MNDARSGLAGERTSLAWERSGLSLAATGAAAAKGLPGTGVVGHPVLGGLVVLLGLSVWTVAALAERHRRGHPQRPTATVADLAPLAIASTVVGLVLMVLAASAA